MAAGNSTVWVGFMDIVPVIGSVKESVELVLAVYERNEKLMKEKEKALDHLMKYPFQKHDAAAQTKYKPAAAAEEFVGLVNVKEVPKGKIGEHTKKVSKNTNLSANEKKARIEEVQKKMAENLKKIGQSSNEELKEELRRSTRGEHVFNNDILRFHSKVLNDFKNKHRIESLRGYNRQTIDQFGTHTLPQNTVREIQYEMVVNFDPDMFYVNANATLYGAFSRALNEAFLKVLDNINPGEETQEERASVTRIIDIMTENEICVDQFAKEIWIGSDNSRKSRFERVKRDVDQMYRTDRSLGWCTDIMRAVATLFVSRQ